MEDAAMRVVRVMVAAVAGSLFLLVGFFVFLGFAGYFARLGDGIDLALVALAVVLAVALIGRGLVFADDPRAGRNGSGVWRMLLGCGLVAGLATAFVSQLKPVSDAIVALTSCEANETCFAFGLYAIWLGVGMAVGIARRSWFTAVVAGLVAAGAAFLSTEVIADHLIRGVRGMDAMYALALLTGLIVGLGIGLVLAVSKPRGGLKWDESVLTEQTVRPEGSRGL